MTIGTSTDAIVLVSWWRAEKFIRWAAIHKRSFGLRSALTLEALCCDAKVCVIHSAREILRIFLYSPYEVGDVVYI